MLLWEVGLAFPVCQQSQTHALPSWTLGAQWLWKCLSVVKETNTVTSCCNLGGSSCQERNLFSYRSRGQQSTAREQQGFITSKGSKEGPRGSSVEGGNAWSWKTAAPYGLPDAARVSGPVGCGHTV